MVASQPPATQAAANNADKVAAIQRSAAETVGPLDLHEALQAKRQIEAKYYPGRNASLSAGEDNAETQTLHDVLAAKQRAENS